MSNWRWWRRLWRGHWEQERQIFDMGRSVIFYWTKTPACRGLGWNGHIYVCECENWPCKEPMIEPEREIRR